MVLHYISLYSMVYFVTLWYCMVLYCIALFVSYGILCYLMVSNSIARYCVVGFDAFILHLYFDTQQMICVEAGLIDLFVCQLQNELSQKWAALRMRNNTDVQNSHTI